MRKLAKLLNFIFLFILSSCYSSRIPNEVLNVIELEDDNLCMMQGVEFKGKDTRKIYWECRLRIINQRISGEFDNYGYSLLYKREFKRIRKIIKNRIKEQKQIAIAEINNSLEEKEHNYCVMLKDQNPQIDVTVYDYFKCREDLEKLRNGDTNFSNLSNDYVIKIFEYQDEIDDDAQTDIVFVERECIKYASNKEKLEKCEEAVKKINQCSSSIDEKIMQRRIDDKVFCTKMSVEKYPDELSNFDDTSTDFNSFGPKMNKIDIVGLREKEFANCYKERSLKIPAYKDYLENQCKVNNLKILEEK